MLKHKLKLGFMAAAALVMSISACKKDKQVIPDVEENELITKVSIKFTNAANAADVSTVTWTDPDGDGGVAPTIGTLTLKTNTNYTFQVTEVLNETAKTPDEQNILAEIEEESDEHLLVYKPVGVNLTITRTDKDKNNFVIGLAGTAATGATTTGTMQVILRHQPGAVKNGSETPGSSDFDTTFPVIIQ